MSLNKKNILIISVLTLAFVLLSVIFLFLGVRHKQLKLIADKVVSEKNALPMTAHRQMVVAKNISAGDCESLTDAKQKNDCYFRLYNQEASLENNVKLCLKINDYILRNNCILLHLRYLDNIKECQRISDDYYKERCADAIGQRNGGIKYCDEIEDDPYEKQECRDRYIAMHINDASNSAVVSVTDAVTSPGFFIQKCESLNTLEYGYLCEANALMNESVSCNDYKDDNKKNLCLSRLLYSTAKSKDDCEKITDTTYQKVCLSIYNNAGNKDYKFDDDYDGLNNEKELWIGTDPFNPDTDGDGMNDYEEFISYRTNPIALNDKEKTIAIYNQKKQNEIVNASNWQADNDHDGLINADEIFYGTDIDNPDSDGDGISDEQEVISLTNPIGQGDMDFDNDSLSDKKELKFGTNPTLKDTNFDGLNDAEAVKKGTEAVKDDTDSDGLNNIFEIKIVTNPLKKDTDDDGLIDGEEVNKYYTNPKNPDTDGDGFKDGDEVKNGYSPLMK